MQKSYILIALAAILLAGSLHFATRRHMREEIPTKVREAYAKWASIFGRLRASPEEANYRLKVFHKNFNFVEVHNNDKSQTYSVNLNQFADMSDEEYRSLSSFKASETSHEQVSEQTDEHAQLGQQAPENVDMRGYLQQEFIQSSITCKDDYAWIAAVNMNANFYISQGVPITYNFSPQTYIDCSANYGNSGCNGGLASKCFDYSKDWGIGTMIDYPYFGYQRPCRVIGGYFKNSISFKIPPNENNRLKAILGSEKRVVSVGVDLNSQEARFYSRGVFSGPCSANPTVHALLFGYGYDIESKKNYWLIMAPYGKMWGEEGIMRIWRFDNDQGDETSSCGLNKYASYPKFSA